jgi:hypothetical protein
MQIKLAAQRIHHVINKATIKRGNSVKWGFLFQVISYDSNRGGVSVITEKGDVTTSFLLIQHADISDSGKYSCSPSNADVASVRVHVLNGELPTLFRIFSERVKISN